MAGVSNYSAIGALQPQQESQADTDFAQNPIQQVPAGIAASVPGGGKQELGANRAFAVGDIYNAYKKAQMDDITMQTQLSAAARNRLTQIWQAGAVNPQLQNDPKIHAQIGQYWKQLMGSDFPVQKGQSFDWNMLQPPKSINELSEPMLKQLQEMDPSRRQAAAKAMNLIDAGDAFLNAPAMLSDSAKVHLSQDYSRLILQGGKNGMTANELYSWINANKDGLDQTMGDGTGDMLLSDNKLFGDMKTTALLNLQKMQAQIAKLQGKDPAAQERIKKDIALAENAHSLADLHNIQSKYIATENQQLPGLDAAKIQQMTQAASKDQQAVQNLQQQLKDLVANGGSSPRAQLKQSLDAANATLRIASQAYYSAVDSGGIVPDDIEAAYTQAQQNVTDLNNAAKTINSAAWQKSVSVANAKRLTGNQAQDANPPKQTITVNGTAYAVGTVLTSPSTHEKYLVTANGLQKQ